jgi:hypothetical protein
MVRDDGYGDCVLVCVYVSKYSKLWLTITLSQRTSPPQLPRVLPVRTQIVGKTVKAYTCISNVAGGQMLLLARCLTKLNTSKARCKKL